VASAFSGSIGLSSSSVLFGVRGATEYTEYTDQVLDRIGFGIPVIPSSHVSWLRLEAEVSVVSSSSVLFGVGGSHGVHGIHEQVLDRIGFGIPRIRRRTFVASAFSGSIVVSRVPFYSAWAGTTEYTEYHGSGLDRHGFGIPRESVVARFVLRL